VIKIVNKTSQKIIVEKAEIADTFLSRLIGLLNREALLRNDALIITRCNSIHMFFMRFPIDVVFIDRDYKVVGLVQNIKPFRISRIFPKSHSVIELASGSILENNIHLGDQIEFIF
jgi:uncharacterized protein